MQRLDNQNLDLFLREIGILPKTDLEDLEETPTPRQVKMWRNPYNENGEIAF